MPQANKYLKYIEDIKQSILSITLHIVGRGTGAGSELLACDMRRNTIKVAILLDNVCRNVSLCRNVRIRGRGLCGPPSVSQSLKVPVGLRCCLTEC